MCWSTTTAPSGSTMPRGCGAPPIGSAPPRRGTSRSGWRPSAGVASTLRAIVTSRVPFLVTGGTGSGKSTLLAAMLAQAPPSERIVVVEDVLELSVDHPHVVHLQSRHANSEGAGAVGLTALVRQSLRM